MDKFAEGVWVTRRNHPPSELALATGIVIAFGGLKPPSEPDEGKVNICRVFIMKSGSASQHFEFPAKVAFLTGGRTHNISPSVADWVMDVQRSSRQCITLAEFQKDFWPLVILLGKH